MDMQPTPPGQPGTPPPPPPHAPPPPQAPPPSPWQPYRQPPVKRGLHYGWWIAIGAGVLLILVVMFAIMLGAIIAAASGEREPMGAKVAVIRVQGEIASSGGGGMFGDAGASAETIARNLRKARRDDSVKAVVLRIDSPGGSVGGSQEIYSEVMRTRAVKPVIVSMGDLAASGGYYVASAANRIVANPGTLTGSIGVIYANMNLRKLFEKIGIEPEVVKGGKHKDMGLMRSLTPEERQMVQTLINEMHTQFIADVAKGRNLDPARVRKLADGRIYSGQQAKRLGLVDELGNFQDAVTLAGRQGGITGEVRTMEYGRGGLLRMLLGDLDESSKQRILNRLLYDRLADELKGSAELQ